MKRAKDDVFLICKILMFSRRWLWNMLFSEMWRCVVLMWTDVSEEHIASIFRVEPAGAGGCRLFIIRFSLVASKVKTDGFRSSYRTTRSHIPAEVLFLSLSSFSSKTRFCGPSQITKTLNHDTGNPSKIRTQNLLNTYLKRHQKTNLLGLTSQIAEERLCRHADQTIISTSYNTLTSE
jgi:hypothetical protein